MIQLDYKSGVPIYDQLINGIIRLRRLGALKGGDPLPSVRTFATQLGINPNTVQRAYAQLEDKGIICSVAGKGSFVSDDEESQRVIKELALKDFEKAVSEAKRIGLNKSEVVTVVEQVFEEVNK